MHKIVVTGCGTEVGKTVVSAILATLLEANYWKPVQCGDEKQLDTQIMKKLLDPMRHFIYAPAYSLKAPLSPHHAARLENIVIEPESIHAPQTDRPLVMETAGGVLAPLTTSSLNIDLFKKWSSQWIVVSKHYLGSINHTLLTIEALKQRQLPILGIIFNGVPNTDSESAILQISQLPVLGRLLPEKSININTIQKYAKQWQARFSKQII